jgi:hypothetical protein
MIQRTLYRLTAATPGFAERIFPWLVLVVTIIAGLGLSSLMTDNGGWHVIALVPAVPGLTLAVWLWVKLSGRNMPEGAKSELGRFARTQGWSAAEQGSLPARGEPFSMGGDHEELARYSGTFRDRTAAGLYYRVRASEEAETAPFDYTVLAVLTDADSPVTRAERRLAGGLFRFLRRKKYEVDLESAEFARKWRVTGRDRRASHEIFQPTVTARLLEDDARDMTISWDANAVMSIIEGQLMSRVVMERHLNVLCDIAERMPAYQTLSGAAGARKKTGEIMYAARPKLALSRVEALLLLVGGLSGLTLWLLVKARRTVELPAWAYVALTVGFLGALAAAGIIRWVRTSRAHRAWTERVAEFRRREYQADR